MKPGDLVKARVFRSDDVGIIVRLHIAGFPEAEVHWLNDLGEGFSWMHLKDLELVSDASR